MRLVRRHRFDQVGECPATLSADTVVIARDDLYRDMPRGEVALELLEHRPPAHVRQVQVQADEQRGVALHQRQRIRSARRDDGLEALAARSGQQQAGDPAVALEDQQYPIAGLDGFAVVDQLQGLRDGGTPGVVSVVGGELAGRPMVGFAGAQRQVHGEGAALVDIAGDQPQFAAQAQGELAADRQPEPGAAVLA
ncbi:hypothetical protein D3C84_631290 [compost metagenome]